jgi:branched-chain amino acid transport system substrate-binding protein
MNRTRKPGISRRATLAFMGAGAATFAAPWVARAQAKTIKIGMPTILSGRVAQLGTSSRNAVMLEVEKVNAAGGLAGRQIEMVIRDSKGQPQEAARIARELVNTDGCEMLLDGEASSGSFAVHEVARDLGVLCIHTCSEASSLTADPKQHIPNAFRCVRQGIHDSIIGAGYAAGIAKAKGLKKWATCSPDYAYGRDTTGEFVLYLKKFAPDVEIISESWPKLFQPDYTEVVTKILQAKPQAMYSCLWGGDLTSYIDQANIYALFTQMEVFAVNMADYTALTVVKNLPKGIHSGDRYIKTFPPTPENAAWGDAYKSKYNEYPTNWSWQNATAVMFLNEAAKKLAEVLTGLTIKCPFGADGTVTMRADDRTLVGYAIGWGTTIPQEPYVLDMKAGDWKTIFELEAEWKKSKGYT